MVGGAWSFSHPALGYFSSHFCVGAHAQKDFLPHISVCGGEEVLSNTVSFESTSKNIDEVVLFQRFIFV